MQPSRSSGNTELNRGDGGLARYRSAPATWLEALLESEEEQPPDVVLDIPNPPLPNASASSSASAADIDLEFRESTSGGSFSNFLRMNSSPAEFMCLLNNSEGFFSNLGIPASYDYASAPSAKRPREAEDVDKLPQKLSASSTPVKAEKDIKLKGEIGGPLDVGMEKLLEDSIMCRARAKRGCATHPRSIAERERRTRISDRIRKLQELVPNMDRQTNTADMLEEAVAYVKFLQKQIEELTEQQKKCECLMNA